MPERETELTAEATARLLLDTSPYLSCDECFARLDEYIEDLVRQPGHDDPAMRIHLQGCGACADEVDALLALVRDDQA